MVNIFWRCFGAVAHGHLANFFFERHLRHKRGYLLFYRQVFARRNLLTKKSPLAGRALVF